MHDKERNAVLLSLIENVNEERGGCGETHIQLGSYLLQELFDIPLDYRFVFYGSPTSFDVREDLAHMYANDIIRYRLRGGPESRSLQPGEYSSRLRNLYDRIEGFNDYIDFIGKITKERTPSELRRLGTALYISREGDRTHEEKAQRIRELQPYVSEGEAFSAVRGADELVAKIKEQRSTEDDNNHI